MWVTGSVLRASRPTKRDEMRLTERRFQELDFGSGPSLEAMRCDGIFVEKIVRIIRATAFINFGFPAVF